MKTVLIAGGAGYIGSVLTGLLVQNHHRVIVLDNLKYGGESLLFLVNNPDFRLIKADITSADEVEAVSKDHQFDTVIHLAAIVGDPACARNPKLAEKVNWQGSLNLLEHAMKKSVKRFIFASTCSNYGKMAEADGLVDEKSPLAPVSLYAELKVRFENVLLNELEKKDSFSPTALRFATAYGPSPRMRFDLTVNEFTRELVLGKELEVFGEQFWRPYCHIYDIARAVMHIMEAKKEKVAYNVFNVGDTKENYQKQMIVREIDKIIANTKVKYVHKDEDPRDYKVSFEKIRAQLGFSISKRVPDGIREVQSLLESRVFPDPYGEKYKNS
jgi:nucleoside-diphosphate-sugar epimerase